MDISLNPFTDIEALPIDSPGVNAYGSSYLPDLKELAVGTGDDVFHADQQGIWLGSNQFANAPFRVSMAGAVTATSMTLTGGTLNFGKTSFTDSTHAGYFISDLGFYFGSAADATKLKFVVATGAVSYVGDISGRSSATLASAIDSSGHFIDANLDTSAKNILASFAFGASGAIQIGTYSAGVSGDIKISPNGIVGRDSSNTTTFTIDATTGNATFRGNVTGSTITGSTLTTGTSGANVNITLSRIGVRTSTTEVAFFELGSDGGVMGLNDTSGNNRLSVNFNASLNRVNFSISGTGTDIVFNSPNDIFFTASGGIVFMDGLSLGSSGHLLSDVRTSQFNGSTPLAGTKIYWVANSSGGAVNRKLTFTDGILTSET